MTIHRHDASDEENPMPKPTVSRRDFLAASGTSLAALPAGGRGTARAKTAHRLPEPPVRAGAAGLHGEAEGAPLDLRQGGSAVPRGRPLASPDGHGHRPGRQARLPPRRRDAPVPD